MSKVLKGVVYSSIFVGAGIALLYTITPEENINTVEKIEGGRGSKEKERILAVLQGAALDNKPIYRKTRSEIGEFLKKSTESR